MPNLFPIAQLPKVLRPDPKNGYGFLLRNNRYQGKHKPSVEFIDPIGWFRLPFGKHRL